jgi:co-chaperonin GroES (HSP10)
MVPDVSDKLEGTDLDLVRATASLRQEEHATTVLFVVKMGPQAYQDQDKFGETPWCKQGDFVLVRAYSGTRFKVYGKEFRMINDDQVEGIVEDPRGISRA